MKKQIAWVFLGLVLALTGCSSGGDDDGGGTTSVTYAGVDAEGATYTLVITETADGGKYAAKAGDSYELTIAKAAETVFSRGTVGSSVGLAITLKASGSGTEFTITVSNTGAIAGIVGLIALTTGTTWTVPAGAWTPVGGGGATDPGTGGGGTTTGGNADLYGVWDGDLGDGISVVLTFSAPNLWVGDALPLMKESGTFTYNPPNLTSTTTKEEGLFAGMGDPVPRTDTSILTFSADKKTMTMTDSEDGEVTVFTKR